MLLEVSPVKLTGSSSWTCLGHVSDLLLGLYQGNEHQFMAPQEDQMPRCSSVVYVWSFYEEWLVRLSHCWLTLDQLGAQLEGPLPLSGCCRFSYLGFCLGLQVCGLEIGRSESTGCPKRTWRES